jgi:5-bromo-4-chloroindolyl phosphate hydrolysis protein
MKNIKIITGIFSGILFFLILTLVIFIKLSNPQLTEMQMLLKVWHLLLSLLGCCGIYKWSVR